MLYAIMPGLANQITQTIAQYQSQIEIIFASDSTNTPILEEEKNKLKQQFIQEGFKAGQNFKRDLLQQVQKHNIKPLTQDLLNLLMNNLKELLVDAQPTAFKQKQQIIDQINALQPPVTMQAGNTLHTDERFSPYLQKGQIPRMIHPKAWLELAQKYTPIRQQLLQNISETKQQATLPKGLEERVRVVKLQLSIDILLAQANLIREGISSSYIGKMIKDGAVGVDKGYSDWFRQLDAQGNLISNALEVEKKAHFRAQANALADQITTANTTALLKPLYQKTLILWLEHLNFLSSPQGVAHFLMNYNAAVQTSADDIEKIANQKIQTTLKQQRLKIMTTGDQRVQTLKHSLEIFRKDVSLLIKRLQNQDLSTEDSHTSALMIASKWKEFHETNLLGNSTFHLRNEISSASIKHQVAVNGQTMSWETRQESYLKLLNPLQRANASFKKALPKIKAAQSHQEFSNAVRGLLSQINNNQLSSKNQKVWAQFIAFREQESIQTTLNLAGQATEHTKFTTQNILIDTNAVHIQVRRPNKTQLNGFYVDNPQVVTITPLNGQELPPLLQQLITQPITIELNDPSPLPPGFLSFKTMSENEINDFLSQARENPISVLFRLYKSSQPLDEEEPFVEQHHSSQSSFNSDTSHPLPAYLETRKSFEHHLTQVDGSHTFSIKGDPTLDWDKMFTDNESYVFGKDPGLTNEWNTQVHFGDKLVQIVDLNGQVIFNAEDSARPDRKEVLQYLRAPSNQAVIRRQGQESFTLNKKSDQKWGIVFNGGFNLNSAGIRFTIDRNAEGVIATYPAAQQALQGTYRKVTSINGQSTSGLTHSETLALIRQYPQNLRFTLEPVTAQGFTLAPAKVAESARRYQPNILKIPVHFQATLVTQSDFLATLPITPSKVAYITATPQKGAALMSNNGQDTITIATNTGELSDTSLDAWFYHEMLQIALRKEFEQVYDKDTHPNFDQMVEIASLLALRHVIIATKGMGIDFWNKTLVPEMRVYFENRLEHNLEFAWTLTDLLKVLGNPAYHTQWNSLSLDPRSKKGDLFTQIKGLTFADESIKQLVNPATIKLLQQNA